MVGLLAEIRDEHGVELPEIDLGGGLGIAYTSDDDPREPHEIAKSLARDRHAASARPRGCALPRLSVEPGRAIVGPTAFTLYEVGTVKPLDGLRTYVSVDGGMSDNIRTALYDAEYSVALVSRTSDAEPMLSRVVGKHCESGDIVVRDAFLPADLAPGDLIAVPGHRRVLPFHGEQLQPRAAAAGRRRTGRRGASDRPPGDGGGSPATGCRLDETDSVSDDISDRTRWKLPTGA